MSCQLKFDGKAGKYFYRAGQSAGSFNLWKKGYDGKWKFYKSVTMTELRAIKGKHRGFKGCRKYSR